MIQLPVMHAPFHSCSPHPLSQKLTRHLTLDFMNEGDRVDIQQFRTLIENVTERLDHLCLGDEKAQEAIFHKNFPAPPKGSPPRRTSPGHGQGYFPFSPDANHGFPPKPPLIRQNAEVYRPAEVPPLIKKSNHTDWPDKVVLKFEPNTVSIKIPIPVYLKIV